MKKSVWLSYDLGVKGDYESLFRWLDSNSAIECGDGVAYFKYETTDLKRSLPEEIQEELSANVGLKKTDRVYMIWKEVENNKIKGKFIFGNRKAAPWAGHAGTPSVIDEE